MSDEEEWAGVAIHQGQPYLITGMLAEFILDYRAYDPQFSASGGAAEFRGGVLTATSHDAVPFLRAMKARTLTPQEADSLAHSGTDAPELLAFMDFDARRYVHSYYDLPLERYVPKGWRGALGDPREALRNWSSRR
jgi:hypothetical protein